MSAPHLDLAFMSAYPSSQVPSLPLFFAGGGMGDGLSQLYFIKLQYTVIHFPSHHALLLANSYKHLDSEVIFIISGSILHVRD